MFLNAKNLELSTVNLIFTKANFESFAIYEFPLKTLYIVTFIFIAKLKFIFLLAPFTSINLCTDLEICSWICSVS